MQSTNTNIESPHREDLSARRDEINNQCLAFLVKATAKVTIVFPITATVLAALFYAYVDKGVLLSWWFAVVLCSVLRFSVHHRYHSVKKEGVDYPYWLKHLLTIDVVTGLTAGTCAAFIAYLPIEYDFLVFVVLIAISLESVGLQSAIKSSFVSFIVALSSALLPCILLFGGQLNYALAILSLVHLLLLWTNFKSLNATMISGLELALTNQQLNNELTQSNKQLEASRDEALRANSAQSRFIADMSHELRTPMQGLLGSISLAQQHTNNIQLQDLLNTAQTAGSTLLNLLNGILELSHAEKGLRKPNVQSCNLSVLCKELCELMAITAQSKGLKIECELEEGLPELVVVDRNRLAQITLNFLSNAVKFTERGQIILRLKSANEATNKYELSVSDTGPGIDANDMSSIFLPYKQLESGENKGGAGLGLAISKELCELINARIEVESEVGRGSTFTLYFSAQMGSQSAHSHVDDSLHKGAEGATDSQERFSGVKVLIAEDEPLSRKVLKAFLESMDIEVTLAINGQEAIDASDEQKFDVILMDCQMPKVDGFSAARHIREHSKFNKTSHMVAMSAHIEQSDDDKAKGAGMNALFSKPIQQSELYTIVAASQRR